MRVCIHSSYSLTYLVLTAKNEKNGKKRTSAKLVSAELIGIPIRLQKLEMKIVECRNLIDHAKQSQSEMDLTTNTLQLSILHTQTAELLKIESQLLETQERAQRDKDRNISNKRKRSEAEAEAELFPPLLSDDGMSLVPSTPPTAAATSKVKFAEACRVRRTALWSHYQTLTTPQQNIILLVSDALKDPDLWEREAQSKGPSGRLRVSPMPYISMADFYFAAMFISSCTDGPLAEAMMFSVKVAKYILDDFQKTQKSMDARYFTIRELLCDGAGCSPRSLPSAQKALDKILHVPLIAALYQGSRESGASWKLFVKDERVEGPILDKVVNGL